MSSTDALSAVCIRGIAMLTMLVSSTDMNIPTIRMQSGPTHELSLEAPGAAGACGRGGAVVGAVRGAVVVGGVGSVTVSCRVVVVDTYRPRSAFVVITNEFSGYAEDAPARSVACTGDGRRPSHGVP